MLETKSIPDLAFIETPRKRKREAAVHGNAPPPLSPQQPLERGVQVRQDAAATVAASESCFTNAAFSSTPKKLIGRRRLAKENNNPFPGLEVKSIADLAEKQQQHQHVQLPTNPFEVLRQPPKKKKREQHPGCFENPGLNLELPEKQFNPYEVVRVATTPSKGFVNPALNLRGSDAPSSLNPFEIHRQSVASATASNPAGVTNPALAKRDTEEPQPTNLKIGLPFAPNVGCRIDFHGISLAQLTPSKLLAEKLVFSPVPTPKRSLGAISEESTIDIGKELDRYQLELENSINEAKLRKNGVVLEQEVVRKSMEVKLPKVSLVMGTDSEAVLMQQVVTGESQMERRLICTRRCTLTEIREASEVDQLEDEPDEGKMLLQRQIEQENLLMEQEQKIKQENEQERERERLGEKETLLEREKLQEKLHEQLKEKLQERVKFLERSKEQEAFLEPMENVLQGEKERELDPVEADVAYASESDEEPDDLADFKAPARFVRAYRPAAVPTKAASKESLHSVGSSKSVTSGEVKTTSTGGMKGMIRKSIRRLMHHTSTEVPEEIRNSASQHHNILSSIRHSLRRRPEKATVAEAEMEPGLPDISIIDSSERTMKLRSSVPQTEYMTIEQLTNEKKHTLRNSIRRSTRDVLRHVFHKSQDAYATAK